jgi:alcohol-forming fatty acyl-CoA reductase
LQVNISLDLQDIGFTEETQAYLINNVQIVLHAAADVRFDQTLKKAIEVNVRGTRDLLRLTKNIKNIEVCVFEFSY